MKWNGDPSTANYTSERTAPKKANNDWQSVHINKDGNNCQLYQNKTTLYGDISNYIKNIEVKRNLNLDTDQRYSAVCVAVTTQPGMEAAEAFLRQGLRKDLYPEAISGTVNWWMYHLSPDWAKPQKKPQDWSSRR